MTTSKRNISFFNLSGIIRGGVLLLMIISGRNSFAQNTTVTENKIKAVFLFNFTKFVDWPESAFMSQDSPFIIGILGGKPDLNDYIEKSVTGEMVGNHTIIVQNYDDEQGPFYCQILYIDLPNSSKIKSALSTVENQSILTIGESMDFNKSGGIVRFYTEENKIRLQINTEAAKTARLNISSKLLNVAKTK